MLRLLFDHHAGRELHDRLSASRALDIERVHDVELLGPTATDPDIWRYAVRTDRVVLMNDQHFIDGTADPGAETHPGVIQYVEYDWAAIAEAIENIEAVMNTEDITDGTELFVPTGWVD